MPNIIDRIVKDAQAPASWRAERFAVLLDAALENMPDDAARHAHCELLAKKWVSDYEQFAHAVDTNRYSGSATAWDYQFVIAAIDERKAKFRPRPTPPNTEFWQGAQA